MNTFWNRMLIIAAVAAIAVAQARGIRQGFICDCHGPVLLTSVDHCHGPEILDSHDHELEDHACDETLADHGQDEDTHEHSEHVESFVAKTQHVPTVQILSSVVQVLPVSEWLLSVLHGEAAELVAVSDTEVDGIDPPPWPARLAHAIALRV